MSSTRTRLFLLPLVVLSLGAIALIAWFGGQPPATEEAELAEARDVTAGEVELEALTPRNMASREEVGSDEPEELDAIDSGTPVPKEGFGSIRGRVVDVQGEPVSAFTIVWWPEGESGFEERSFEASTGRFEIGGLPWGRWEVVAMAGARGRGAPTATQVPHTEELVLIVRDDSVVSGTVRKVDGNPAPGAEVSWREGTVLADEVGRFRLEGVWRDLSLEARWEDQVTAEPLLHYPQQGLVHEDVDLQLVLGGRLTVVVLDGEGQPDPGQWISLEPRSSWWGRSARADRLGEHDFGVLPPGPYLLTAGGPGRDPAAVAPAARREVSVEVIAGETVHAVLGGRSDLQVVVHGLVTRAGRPVEGEVTAFPEGAGALRDSRSAKVDGKGRFEMILESAGACSFQIKPDGGGRVTVPVDVPSVASFDLHLELPEGHLSGLLLSGDEPLGPGHPIALQRREAVDHLGSERISMVETDGEGRWSFDGLAAGTYSIIASFPSSSYGNTAEMGVGRLEAIRLDEGGRIENLHLRWETIGMLRCRVTDLAGQPVAGAAIFARDLEGEWVYSNARVYSQADGWAYCPLPTGSYTLAARTADSASAESGPIDVEAIEQHQLEFPSIELQLAPGGGLRATLLDSDGRPVRARFSVRDSKGRERTGTTCAHDRARVTEHGRRSDQLWIRPLPPGDYRVTATAPDGRMASADMTLRAGDDEVLELTLE